MIIWNVAVLNTQPYDVSIFDGVYRLFNQSVYRFDIASRDIKLNKAITQRRKKNSNRKFVIFYNQIQRMCGSTLNHRIRYLFMFM